MSRSVAVVTLGCARNEVDSEELAGRLSAQGWDVVEDPDTAETVLVNTCGFVESAKKDSIDTLLAAADTGRRVVAVGCLAERYGAELAQELPEADAVLSFDDYADIGARLDDVVAGRPLVPHTPRDRRTLLPVTPVARRAQSAAVPGHAALSPRFRTPLRRRLGSGPVAPLKIASGCDRRCSFCAIPGFRGSFVSRTPEEILAEAEWLAGQGVRELVLVSENSTSYGKDLGDLRLLESLLPQLAAVSGIVRVRVSYLQPAEMRPTLVEVMTSTPGVAAYFDLSFQHASGPVLRRMRRFGDAERSSICWRRFARGRPLRASAATSSSASRGRRGPTCRARALPHGRAARRRRGVRLLRRGRHRGRRAGRQGPSGDGLAPRRAGDPAGRGAHRPARGGPRGRASSTCWWSRSKRRGVAEGAPRTRRPRSTARPRSCGAGGSAAGG